VFWPGVTSLIVLLAEYCGRRPATPDVEMGDVYSP
jgi:hypothetical protein